MNPRAGGEVLHNMHLERQPLRVGRARTAAGPVTSREAESDPAQESLLREARAAAERAGFDEGLRRGLAEAETRREPALRRAVAEATAALQDQQRRLAALQAALEAALPDCLRAAQDEVVALCFGTLCRMLGPRAVEVESLRAQVAALAAQGLLQPDAAIHVHPQDALQLLGDTTESKPSTGFRWIADPDVAIGGCIVRSGDGGLDARLEAMLDACRSRLLAARAWQAPAEVTS